MGCDLGCNCNLFRSHLCSFYRTVCDLRCLPSPMILPDVLSGDLIMCMFAVLMVVEMWCNSKTFTDFWHWISQV